MKLFSTNFFLFFLLVLDVGGYRLFFSGSKVAVSTASSKTSQKDSAESKGEARTVEAAEKRIKQCIKSPEETLNIIRELCDDENIPLNADGAKNLPPNEQAFISGIEILKSKELNTQKIKVKFGDYWVILSRGETMDEGERHFFNKIEQCAKDFKDIKDISDRITSKKYISHRKASKKNKETSKKRRKEERTKKRIRTKRRNK
eukprot:GHVP01048333.1.p1 GENE.GHVP01048333.1~~GHVP01048333.1.p1  ORF type:complete len:203 (+),score=42.68 GHVP01048333.1:927-1535(+)